jgi:hypothetical protein
VALPVYEAILAAFQLSAQNYTLTQPRYDLRKLQAHALLERDGRRYACRRTDKGIRVALMFILFRQRIGSPLANRLFNREPAPAQKALSQIEAAYHKLDASVHCLIDLLAA